MKLDVLSRYKFMLNILHFKWKLGVSIIIKIICRNWNKWIAARKDKVQNWIFHCSHFSVPKISLMRNVICYVFIATKVRAEIPHSRFSDHRNYSNWQDPLPHSPPMNFALRTTTDHYRSCGAASSIAANYLISRLISHEIFVMIPLSLPFSAE